MFSQEVLQLSAQAKTALRDVFAGLEQTAEANQFRVMRAFADNRVSEGDFAGTTGYGYNDRGRDTLDRVLAACFGCESALVRHNFVSGTHALTVALFALLRPGDLLLSATGKPYDTLEQVIGIADGGGGSLAEFGVRYQDVPLSGGRTVDYAGLAPRTWAGIGYVVVCSTFLSYLMVPIGQHHLRPTVVSMYNYVQPVVAVLFTVAIGLDTFGFTKAGAALCVFAGVWLVTKSKSRAQLDADRLKGGN